MRYLATGNGNVTQPNFAAVILLLGHEPDLSKSLREKSWQRGSVRDFPLPPPPPSPTPIFSLDSTVEPPVVTTSRKRPPLLGLGDESYKPSCKLYYFHIRGRAEDIQLAFSRNHSVRRRLSSLRMSGLIMRNASRVKLTSLKMICITPGSCRRVTCIFMEIHCL